MHTPFPTSTAQMPAPRLHRPRLPHARAGAAGRPGRGPALARGSRGSEEGQALVEFTLLLFPLLVLVLAVVWFGVALNDWQDETHLASEAARYAAVSQNPGEGEGKTLLEWVTKQIPLTKPCNESKCESSPAATICSPSSTVGDYVEVKLSYPYQWLPLFNLKASETTLTSTAQMRIEVPPATPYPTKC